MTMTKWTDEKITRALKSVAREPNVLPWADRVWDKIEARVVARQQRGFWKQINPWGRPYRLALAATSFCAVLIGAVAYQQSVSQAELASYILNVSNPRVSVPEDLGSVKTPVFLSDSNAGSEGAASTKDLGTVKVPILLGDDNQASIHDVNFSAGDDDDILLQI
jgi:hypothetical protein